MIEKFWNWIDERDIDKHVVSIAILWGTRGVTMWAMEFANQHGNDGNAALIIAAVVAPYMALQAAAVQQYFKARSTPT